MRTRLRELCSKVTEAALEDERQNSQWQRQDRCRAEEISWRKTGDSRADIGGARGLVRTRVRRSRMREDDKKSSDII